MGNTQMTITSFGPQGGRHPLETHQLRERLDASRLHLPPPFDAGRVELVASVADAIIRRKAEVSPFVTYLGFWTRLAALRQLERSFRDRDLPGTLRRPRGLAFHLPPKNVETIFLYSWILSYLAGNANVVRMPQELSPEVSWVLDQFLGALEATGERTQMFIHYPSDSEMSAVISAHCDARVVWGGDAKIAAFERLPLRNGGKSLWFGDRSSLGVLKGAAIAALDAGGTDALAHRLFNDVFVFDQMACSSPQALYVVGSASEHAAAVKALLGSLSLVAAGRGAASATGQQITKMAAAFSAAATGDANEVSWRGAELTAVFAAGPDRIERRVGGGFLGIAFIPDLADLNGLLRERDQTVTHFGFSAEEIRLAAERYLGPGVSRWAPVGAALDFDHVWDGYDILFELTRSCRLT
ncbi:acyl-CoA reductase [Azorhizobium doebereinerae]|uniref:acyl-CoA reductase n=1 Tax=Azorhizobium doebereinerae TaxID=281091 RepID=UPI00040CE74D|nr:acyl-CoA reductase [Azorhizobium doebereinerae]